jgi:glucoamylase
MLAATTPTGRGFHRYDVDGYGEWLDGSGWPRRHFGIGRLWPLLTGERGHFDVLAGGSATTELAAMLMMRGRGGLLPEQIWDAGPLPWRGLEPGAPTASAMPLAWAHSELIKLALTRASGTPVEQLQVVTSRYQGGAIPQSARWFWRDRSPVTSLPSGRDLVVADTQGFTLHYGLDDWDPATIAEQPSVPLGLGLFGVTLTPGDLRQHQSLQFVRRYDDGSWESSPRHDVALRTGPQVAVRLHPRHVAALSAAGIGRQSAPR